MPEILNLLAPLLLGSINRKNLTKRAKKEQLWLLLVKRKGLFQKFGAVSLVCYWDSHEMLMFPLLMAGQIMHPSNGMHTVCVYIYKHLENSSYYTINVKIITLFYYYIKKSLLHMHRESMWVKSLYSYPYLN
jgi:hypothetical protein